MLESGTPFGRTTGFTQLLEKNLCYGYRVDNTASTQVALGGTLRISVAVRWKDSSSSGLLLGFPLFLMTVTSSMAISYLDGGSAQFSTRTSQQKGVQ